MEQSEILSFRDSVRIAFAAIEDKTSDKQKYHTLFTRDESTSGKLVMVFSNGLYRLDDKTVNVHHLMITYMSYECVERNDCGWYANGTQYFHPTQLDDAINVFLGRVNSAAMHRSYGNDDNSIPAVCKTELALLSKD